MQGIAELRVRDVPAVSQRRLAARRRLRALIGAAGALFAGLVIAIAGGSGASPPAAGAASLVPADALAYVHLSTDAGRPAVKQALSVAARLPDFARLSGGFLSRLVAIAGGSGSASFAGEIRPWLGKEAALAFLDTPTATAGSLIVLDVANRGRAQAFVAQSGAVSAGEDRGVPLLRYASGTELAFVRHYLVLGQDASVRASIDVTSGIARSLAGDGAYQRAASGEPADRVLDAYASAAGVRRLMAPSRGAVGAVAALLNQPALAGVSAALSPAAAGARIWVHSVLDPTLARLSAPRPAPFVPTLQSTIPAGSAMLLDLTGLDKDAPRVLGAASAAGVAGQIAPLLARLGAALRAEGVDVQGILSIFNGETAVAVVPATASSRPPSLVIVARTADEARTSQQLASLEVPLEQLFPAPTAGPGQAPMFNDRQVAGITAHQLSLTPGLQLDYAVFNGLVVISTSLDGIAAVAGHQHAIAQEQGFREAVGSRPQRVSSLLFLDFSQLLSLGEQTGITRSARFLALQPDLQKIRTVGLSSTSGEDDSTAELFLQIP
jgi:hypothetical protein